MNPWTVGICQAPLSMGFPRHEYWSGLPFSSPGNLPNLGIEPRSPAVWADSLLSEPPGTNLLGVYPRSATWYYILKSITAVHHIKKLKGKIGLS